MPIFVLSPESLDFPDPRLADPPGILAVGGDLRPQRLLAAYAQGIFPWPHEGGPLCWWSPDPRLVLRPDKLHVSRSLAKTLRRQNYQIRFDSAFDQVIRRCAKKPRPGQQGTWITEEMIAAYTELHHLGFAHSAEAWRDDQLVGGLYGVSLGGAFFGESMFTDAPDASKAAFVVLVETLHRWGFDLVDCQVTTAHLLRFGAEEIARDRFLAALSESLKLPTRRGPWDPSAAPP